MAKKPYNVAERFQEVARRASGINAAPSSQKKMTEAEENDENRRAYESRPGAVRGPNSGKDVNLPLEGEMLKKKKAGLNVGPSMVK